MNSELPNARLVLPPRGFLLRTPYKMLLAPVPPLRLTGDSAALVLMNVQHFTSCRDKGLAQVALERGIIREFDEYYDQVDAALPNIDRLLAACRGHGLRIIHTLLLSQRYDRSDLGRQLQISQLPLPGGPPEREIRPEAAPMPGELVLPRSTYGLFVDTRLDDFLVQAGANTIILAGMLADVSVAWAARDAADRGFGVVVVKDASASETLDWHAHTMRALVGGLICVRTTGEVVEMLEGTRT